MNKNQTTTAPLFSATDVAEALALIDSGDVPCIDLTPDDSLWQDVPEILVKPLAWMDGEPVGWDQGAWVHRVLPLDAEGRKVALPSSLEWGIETAALPPRVKAYWLRTPNSAVRVGELLVISLGHVFPNAEIDVDGERMVELISPTELHRRQRQDNEAWLAEHPDVVAARRDWMQSIVVENLEGLEGVEIHCERDLGPVNLAKYATYADGRLRWDDGDDAPYVSLATKYREGLSVQDMRDLVDALMKAIPLVEDAQVQS